MKKIVKGNDFTLKIPVMKMVEGQAQAFPLPACTDVTVQVCNQFRRIPLAFEIDVKEDNVLLARVEGDQMSLGTYAIEVKGKIFGNDWRSNEYPQFSIVAKNADADTEFGETDEGDNSVEMDTAMVILSPSVELSDLINKANEALKNNKETNDTLNTNEEARKEAETQRVSAESERVSAEQTRVSAEDARMKAEVSRVSAESDRVRAEDARTKIEIERQVNELTRRDNETKRIAAEQERAKAEEARATAEDGRANAETKRVDAEAQRVSDENKREIAESHRASAETERVMAEEKRQTDTSAAIGNMTKRINTAIDEFNAHRTEFDEVESARVTSENSRVEAETARGNAEKARVTSETERATAETTRAKAESTRQTEFAKAVKATNDAAAQANTTNESIKTNEQERVEAETNRKSAEKSRAGEEGIRQESETERIRHETERQANEQKRVEAENKRIKAEEQRNKILAQAKSDCEAAAQAADSAAAAATTAKNKAELAAMEAEKVNITMQGSTITVTNKKGEQKSIDVIDTDETVTVKIASSVEGISIKGQKINVFLNHDTKTPQQYVTDETGTAIFSVHRGEYYEVNFTVYANAQPIAPVGYTAVRVDREIAVEYMPYDEETSEKVIVTVTKYIDDVGSPWEGKTVQCTYDKKTTDYVTDSKGQTNILIPVGKEYTINVENEDGYYVKFYNNKRTYTAKVPQRMLAFNMYQFKTGLYCVDSNLNEYTIDEWVATGRDAEEVVAIKVADQNLMLNRGTFMMRTSDLRNTSALISRQWCTQNLLFESIATNGNNSKDANYWNGEQSTFLIRQEAQERSLSVPAAEYAYNTIFTIGEQDLHGFLMSIGQEYVHISNFGLIREMLRTLYGDTVAEAYYKFMSNNWRWTSTQYSSTYAWLFNSSANYSSKAYSYRVLPVFAC